MAGEVSIATIKNYTENKTWTKLILGSAHRTATDSPFGNFTCESKSNLEYRTEEFKIDLVFSKIQPPKTDLFDIRSEQKLNANKDYYPRTYEIIVEHENDVNLCWEEMYKLTRIRAKLKVLVTYLNYNINDSLQLNLLTKNFSKIVKECNEEIIVNGEEYLLIAAKRHKVNDKNIIDWNYISFSSTGEPQGS